MIRFSLLLFLCAVVSPSASPVFADFMIPDGDLSTITPREGFGLASHQVFDIGLGIETPSGRKHRVDGAPMGGIMGLTIGIVPVHNTLAYLLLGASRSSLTADPQGEERFSLVVHNDHPLDSILVGLYLKDGHGNFLMTPLDQLVPIPADGPPGTGHLLSLDLTNPGDFDFSAIDHYGPFVATRNAQLFQVSFSNPPEVIVPEPASAALLFIGMTGLGIFHRQRSTTSRLQSF